jgi:uncharacterized protein with gpF-like domain
MVLDQRLTGIEPLEGVTFEEQARIELEVMWKNWRSHQHEQEAEAWELVLVKWGEVISQLGGEDVTKKAISSHLSWHSAQLFSAGLSNTVEAIDRKNQES